MNFVEELRWRGMVHDMMPGTEEVLTRQPIHCISDTYVV